MGNDVVDLAVGAQTHVIIAQPTPDEFIITNATLVRTLGFLTLKPTAANANVFVRCSIIVAEMDAVVAGVFADPWVDPAPWVWEYTTMLITNSISDPASVVRIPIDSQAKRKFDGSHLGLVFVIDNLAASGTTVNFFLAIKALFLH